MAAIEVTELSGKDKEALEEKIINLLKGLSEENATDIIESVEGYIKGNLIVGEVNPSLEASLARSRNAGKI